MLAFLRCVATFLCLRQLVAEGHLAKLKNCTESMRGNVVMKSPTPDN